MHHLPDMMGRWAVVLCTLCAAGAAWPAPGSAAESGRQEAVAEPGPQQAAPESDSQEAGPESMFQQAAPGPDPQPAAPEPGDTILSGTLRLGGQPADTGTVVLHRVTPEEAGPLDSLRVGPGGAFEFRLPAPPVAGSGEVFFASSRYEGILYFGEPIAAPEQLDSAYVIDAYRTRVAPEGGVPLTVGVRNLFIDQGPMGWRVTDLFEVRNDSSVTWVPGPDDRVVWRHPLPPEGLSFRVGQGDVAPDVVRFADGEMAVHGAIPPGERLYVIQYEVENLEFSLPLAGVTETIEVLVEEPAPSLRMEGLTRTEPVQLEPERRYMRWTGADLAAGEIRARRGEEGSGNVLPWMGVGLALLLLGAGVWAVQRVPGKGGALAERGPSGPAAPAEPASPRGAVALEIAKLDEEFEGRRDPSEEEVARYRRRRAELMERLSQRTGPAAADP